MSIVHRDAQRPDLQKPQAQPPAPHWDAQRPIYQQLAELLAAALVRGEPAEAEAMPSVRTLASLYLLNPMTVQRALAALADEGLIESRRGLGLFVVRGARARLKAAQRSRFLSEEWPRLRERLQRLEIGPEHLQWEEKS